MGFQVEINSILRSDEPYPLVKGGVYDFHKVGSRVFFDTLPVWLTRTDWTALAEIQVITQTRTPKEISGQFRALHVYSAAEQAALTAVFRRLYASNGDFNIYLLMAGADYQKAKAAGTYAPPGLEREGFIHASPLSQLDRVANKYYVGVKDVRLLLVALDQITPEVRWEPATGGLYPHIYGPLNMSALVQTLAVAPGPDGVFHIQLSPASPSTAGGGAIISTSK